MDKSFSIDKVILVAAGGTGGHINPGVAIVKELLNQFSDSLIYFFTLEKNKNHYDIKQLEEIDRVMVKIYSDTKIPSSLSHWIQFFRNIASCFRLIQTVTYKKSILVSIGLGGYPSFPLILWSFFFRVPYVLCEQNKIYSRVNRIMSYFAKRIYLSFPKKVYKKNEICTGNPIRDIFYDKKIDAYQDQYPTMIKNILILGGSQGANDLNNLYLHCIRDSFFKNYSFTISTGKQQYGGIKSVARKQDNIVDFIYDIPSAILNSDIIVSRSGSSSVFEIYWGLKPVVFIPYPYAINNHQYHNATVLEEYNIAKIIDIRPFECSKVVENFKIILSSDFYHNAVSILSQKKKSSLLNLQAEKTIANDISNYVSKV